MSGLNVTLQSRQILMRVKCVPSLSAFALMQSRWLAANDFWSTRDSPYYGAQVVPAVASDVSAVDPTQRSRHVQC